MYFWHVYNYALYICTYFDLVATALPQTNTVTTTTRRREITTPQQAVIQETIAQGPITTPTEESHEYYEVTSPVSESEEGYWQSTGINLEQERNGMYVRMYACM